jgi:hypothetical protein
MSTINPISSTFWGIWSKKRFSSEKRLYIWRNERIVKSKNRKAFSRFKKYAEVWKLLKY